MGERSPPVKDDSNSYPFVSVVLVTWNGEELLRAHLPSLLGIDYPAFEAIVVDNG